MAGIRCYGCPPFLQVSENGGTRSVASVGDEDPKQLSLPGNLTAACDRFTPCFFKGDKHNQSSFMKCCLSFVLLCFLLLSSVFADDALKHGSKSKIFQKLRTIKLRDVSFEDMPTADAARWIELQSREQDPEHKGIRIVIEGDDSLRKRHLSDDELFELGLEAKRKAYHPPPNARKGDPGVLNLRDIPLLNGIKFLTTIYSLRYRIEPDRVVIFDPKAEGARKHSGETLQPLSR